MKRKESMKREERRADLRLGKWQMPSKSAQDHLGNARGQPVPDEAIKTRDLCAVCSPMNGPPGRALFVGRGRGSGDRMAGSAEFPESMIG